MKLFLLFLAAISADSVARLKTLIQKIQDSKDAETETASIVAGVFDVAGFDSEETVGKIAIKLCTHKPEKIHLSKEQQQPKWIPINEANSPMQSGKWKPAANGFRLENQQGEQLHCSANEGKILNDALLIDFNCEAHKDLGEKEPRFARVASTFWLACPDGHVPYGWPSQWGDFNYANYAVIDTGILGCAYVSPEGYCFEKDDGAAIHANFGYNDSPSNAPVSFFPFDSFAPGDLIPGSRFYTSTQPGRGVVVSGSTTSSQPATHTEESAAVPGTTTSVQPAPPAPVPDTLRLVPISSSSAPPFAVGPSSRFRGERTTFSTTSPPFSFSARDTIEEKAQRAAQKEEELEQSLKKAEEEGSDDGGF